MWRASAARHSPAVGGSPRPPPWCQASAAPAGRAARGRQQTPAGGLFTGNFDSLDFSYEENKQHGGIDFNFEFTANRIYDSAQGVNFFVESIDSPVPSPSDSRWSRPQTQPRQGNIFDAFTITKRPESGPFGDNPFGGNNRPAPTSAGFFTRGNTGAARRGRVRGGDF